ncbi:hypothetical protein VaNZ11_013768, partial [Volvox africanus]
MTLLQLLLLVVTGLQMSGDACTPFSPLLLTHTSVSGLYVFDLVHGLLFLAVWKEAPRQFITARRRRHVSSGDFLSPAAAVADVLVCKGMAITGSIDVKAASLGHRGVSVRGHPSGGRPAAAPTLALWLLNAEIPWWEGVPRSTDSQGSNGETQWDVG